MIRKATLVLIAAIGIASPALAQSWDPDMGTGNLVAINNGAAAVHHSASPNGRNAFAMVPRGGEVSGYEALLATH
ncbi:MAG TPA: hypothetical protein VN633_03515 [Bryobacteraceae bacterium]|nr:hypothetical protein [Bryobacteraceae bacterium]